MSHAIDAHPTDEVINAAAAESWHEPIDSQDAADEAVAEDVSNWNA